MILFSACCICGLIGGILNVQFVRAMVKRTNSLYSLHLAFLCLASLGILGCTLSTWLTCRLASSEQKRLFLERDLSLHHSVEMGDKVKAVCGWNIKGLWDLFCFYWKCKCVDLVCRIKIPFRQVGGHLWNAIMEAISVMQVQLLFEWGNIEFSKAVCECFN